MGIWQEVSALVSLQARDVAKTQRKASVTSRPMTCGRWHWLRRLLQFLIADLLPNLAPVEPPATQMRQKRTDGSGADLFGNLPSESFPEWASIPELLTAIEAEIGRSGRQQIEKMLDGRKLPEFVNVQDLLFAIQEELDSPYFSSYLRG
ncbi:unnamed protein product [Sphagnum balticum]